MAQTEPKRSLSLTHAPIFFAFFTWGFGTGAQHLARPLFAYALTKNVFLVAVVIAMNAIPRIFTAPATGFLTDRIGRKPLAIFGAALRGVTNVGQFMSGDFATFLVLEFVGQIGVSMWNTSSNVLLSDVTQTANRGKVLALRQMSTRMGFVAGPLIGGLVAAAFDLNAVFLVNGVSKVIIVVVVLFLVSETRPKRVAADPDARAPQKGEGRAAVLAVMRTRSFAALAITLVGFSMAQTAILQALLPIYASTQLGADEGRVGALVSVAAVVAFLLAYPNGMVSDRFGRKVSMVPGLLLLSGASTLLTVSDTYLLVLIAVAIQGSGEGLTMGTAHTYAMDLAPKDHRGAFLGVTMMFQAAGAFAGPMVIGALYHGFSPPFAFATLAVWLALASLAMGVFAKETAGPRAVDRTPVL
ncbi:MAG: MFS transporter [Chloroflexi bacterium]|nr:MFS transporter [Chloroflexota bacterium]